MKDNKEKTKQLLIYLLIFIIGFAAGSTIAFKTVFNKLSKHNIEVNLWP